VDTVKPDQPLTAAEISEIKSALALASCTGRDAQVAEGVLIGKWVPRLLDEIERLQAAREVARLKEIEGFWHTSCEHVKEALELMGVDVTVAGFVPDTWTLREHCKMKADEIERLRGLLKKSESESVSSRPATGFITASEDFD
jgi:hypothetical protein